MAAYRDILARAQGVASTPYQAYSGELTAPINSQQQAGIAGINSAASYASPYISDAAGLARASTSPITASTIQGYQNPYTQQVVDATLGQMRHDNGVQNASLVGNQISQGALGGNATGVAKAILAGQQGRTMASTTAQLYDQSYRQALSAAQSQQQTGLAGANALANYGISGQNAALAGAGAQIGAGNLMQQNEQARLNALYGQYAQAQAYPYQQTQWLAGIGTGVGGALGSSSTSSTTAPAPNQTAQYLGAGLSAAGLFLSDERAKEDIEEIGRTNDGQKIYRYRYKGSPQLHIGLMAQDVEQDQPDMVHRGVDGMRYVDIEGATDDSVRRAGGGGVLGYAAGGVPKTPWGDAVGWIPEMAISSSRMSPGSAPSAPKDTGGSFDPTKMAQGIVGVGKGLSGLDWGGLGNAGWNNWSGDSWGGGSFRAGDAWGGSSAQPLDGLSAADYGEGFATGGGVVGMSDPRQDEYWPQMPVPGDEMSFDERAAPVREAIAGGSFDPQGLNGLDPKGGALDFAGTPGMDVANAGLVPTPMARPEGAGAPVVAEDDEEATVPTGVAGAASGRAGPGVMAFQPEGPQSYGNMPDAITQPRGSGIGLGLISPNAQTGLLAAGLGMLASRSPNLGNAIGDGGIAGVSAYGAGEERDRKIAAEAAKLASEARQQNFTNTLNLRKQGETERHNKASEKGSREGRAPMGMQFNAQGQLEPIPGWLPTLEKAAKARKGPEGEVMDDETAQFMADRIIAGDTKVLTGLGRGAQGAANIMKVQQLVARRAASGEPISQAAREILQNAAQFEGLKTAERTQAGIMSKLSVYGRTAFNATDIALELSKEVPRTDFQPVNKIINAARTKTGDPKIVALGQALMTLTNEYARAIGGGHGTVHDKEAAEKRLSEAQSHAQLEAVIKVMQREILAEERAMPAARQHIRDIYNPSPKGAHGKSIADEHGAPSPKGPVPGASGLQEGRTGKINGRPVVVRGGKLIYSDDGSPAQ